MASITQPTPVAKELPSSRKPGRGFAPWGWLRRGAPTAAVIAVLSGLALWGHQTGWTLPKFSALIGAEEEAVEAWCAAHNVPSAICIECQPDLLPPNVSLGWCKVHGVADCPWEHPEMAQLAEPVEVTTAMLEAANRALATRPRPENNSRCLLHQRRIQFASQEAVAKAGVDVDVVSQAQVVEAIVANGEVVYDQTKMAHLASRVIGTVWRVEKNVGDKVAKGDVLALVDSVEVGQAKSELLKAIAEMRLTRANVGRIAPLAQEGIIGQRQLQEAEAAFSEAKIRIQTAQQALVNLGLPVDLTEFGDAETDEIGRRIQFLGLPAQLAASLDAGSTTSNLFPLRSPLAGVIVARHVVEGEVVDSDGTLFEVADVSRLSLELDVRHEDARYLALNQTVYFRPGDNPLEPEVTGHVGWISTAADDQTRTVAVRVELPNDDGRLRANTFGTGRIILRDEPAAIVVPSEAVHWDGNCYVVFVRDKNYFVEGSPKFFHVRSVRPGVKQGDMTEIIAGLLPGEVIANQNSVVLEAQLLKANLGAGCGCADGH